MCIIVNRGCHISVLPCTLEHLLSIIETWSYNTFTSGLVLKAAEDLLGLA